MIRHVPLHDTVAQARQSFVTVLMHIIHTCNLTRYDQELFIVLQDVQNSVYTTVKRGFDATGTNADLITAIVLLTVLGIDMEEYNAIQTILADTFVIFPALRNAARVIWTANDYRTARATLTNVLSGTGPLMNDVCISTTEIDFKLGKHGVDLKRCFVAFAGIILKSMHGVRRFPSNEKALLGHLATRSVVVPCAKKMLAKYYVRALESLKRIPDYLFMKDAPVSFSSVAAWLIQFTVILLVTSLVDNKPFLPLIVRNVTDWLI